MDPSPLDTPITKRLIISGLTPSITADDISRRLTTFGTVKAADGFGLTDGLGRPRKFGYVTLETTTGKLAKCMNLLSGSTWKGAKLRFGEAKLDFKERIALENKVAAEEPPSGDNDDSSGEEAKPDFKEEKIALENKVAAEEPHMSGVNDENSVHSESVGSDDIDDDEVMEEEENEQETENPLVQVTSTKSTELKDLFAPREEEEAGFSLLGHLDLDIEMDNEVPFSVEQPTSTQEQTPIYTPLPSTTHPNLSSQAPIVLSPKQALFFPYPQQQQGNLSKVRQKDIFDLIKDNHWNWRDPSVGFYRTGTEDDIRKRWEEGKSELTKEWKKRWREAGKANRWRRNDADIIGA